MDIITRKVDNFSVGQRNTDGYINATALTAAHRERTGQRKDVRNWLKSARTQESITHLSSITGIPVMDLYQVVRGGEGPGTWIHPSLAVRFAIWVSDEFGYMVEQWVEQWMKNASQPSQQPALPPMPTIDERLHIVERAMSLLSRLGGLDDRTKLAYCDQIRNITLGDQLSQTPSAGAEQIREWTISDRVVVLGYKAQKNSVLSGIGTIAANLYRKKYNGQEPPSRGQYVDGAYRTVKAYTTVDLDIIDQAIRTKLGEPPSNVLRLPPAQ